MHKLPSPNSLQKRRILVQDTESPEKIDPKSWKFYYKLEKERKDKIDDCSNQAGRFSMSNLSPLKSCEVISSGLQSVAEKVSVAPKPLINVSRNEM